MKKLIATISIFSLFSLTAYASYPEYEKLTDDRMLEIINTSIQWMQVQQEDNGHMRYEYIPFLDRYVDDDNMVRQAGALYQLGEVLIRAEEDTYNLGDTIEKSISYFDENSYNGVYAGIQFKCIKKAPDYCTLGGTSLALIGILDLMQSDPDYVSQYHELAESYKDFIIAMSLKNGGYQNNFYFEGTQPERESSFSNGEAFLALVRYYQYDPQPEIKDLIDRSFEYFTVEYGEGAYDPNFYLWGMAAIKDLQAMEPKQEYVDYVKAYTDWRIDGKGYDYYTTHNYCGYIEGVTSAYSVLETELSDTQLKTYAENIDFWLAKTAELQITKYDVLRISFNDNRFFWLTLQDYQKSIGGFLTDFKEPVQRIDFTQHCLSSYLQKYVDIDGNKL